MREIKFRVWSKSLGRFYQNEYFTNEEPYAEEDKIVLLSNNNQIWQQFTGLKDKNGKEIYEGDIMASRGNYITDECDDDGNFLDLKNVVVWSPIQTRFGLIPTKEFENFNKLAAERPDMARTWTCSITTFKEVVGNIMENPELLQ